MENNLKRLCTICARGGSKGVVNKNLRIVKGRPILAFTIEQAKKSGLFSLVAVSSDSDEILNAARNAGADLVIKRPDHLATDTAAKLPVIQHAVAEAEKHAQVHYDVFVDLDCTSPLRSIEDIRGAVQLLESSDAENVITGASARRSPYFNLVEADQNGYVSISKKPIQPIIRRQDAPKCYDMNASIYAWKRAALLNASGIFLPKTKLFEMPEERSLDIDSELDFQMVSMLLNQREDL
jgi:CMP-N,N'-diacetyllegionaminic acid synthase